MADRILFCAINFVMIETLEIFWSAKIELRVVILATFIIFGFWYWQDYRNKKEIKKQERLNEIKTN